MDCKDRNWLYTKYIIERLTCEQIAEICHCHHRTIHQRLVKFSIPRRKSGVEHLSEERKQRIRDWHKTHPMVSPFKGKKHSLATRFKMSLDRRGKNHPNWKGGTTKIGGYVLVWCPEHPRADRHHYVKRSRLGLEAKLGRYLLEGCVPHHKNLIKDDDSPENLEEKTKSGHHKLHSLITNSQRIYKKGYHRPFMGNQYVTTQGNKKN